MHITFLSFVVLIRESTHASSRQPYKCISLAGEWNKRLTTVVGFCYGKAGYGGLQVDVTSVWVSGR